MNLITTFPRLNKIDVRNPKEHQICIIDIAWALSRMNRFSGFTIKNYSVAEHSVRLSHMVDTQYAKAALLHDAAEAYLGDVPQPIKEELPDYRSIEANLLCLIFDKFDLNVADLEKINELDRELSEYESKALRTNLSRETLFYELTVHEAALEFIARYMELFHGNE